MDYKPRILWVTEATFLNTGFATLSKGILERLYSTGKYELMELGSYADINDPRIADKILNVPWGFVSPIPNNADQNAVNQYNSNIYAQFGELAFEQVCLDFMPDVVIDVRDHWMCSFQVKSPFRRNYKLLWCPTIDGNPQKTEWLEDYKDADRLLTYTNFGKETVEQESGGSIKVFDVLAPGVEIEIFKSIENKAAHRQQFGLPPDMRIILTVMRNQKRKLFPDLINAFCKYLNLCKDRNNDDLFRKSYLYLHTSYPDVGFDIARLLAECEYPDKVLVTYFCNSCGAYYPSFFNQEVSICKRCGQLSAHMPNTGNGLSREQLANIYNFADLYVQYSICEGFSMTCSEAKACEIPCLVVEHSAMLDHGSSPGGEFIDTQRLFYESVHETEQMRALPDDYDCAQKMYKFMTKSDSVRKQLGVEGKEFVSANQDYNRATNIVENAIASLDLKDHSTTWLNPSRYFMEIPTKQQIPQFTSPEQLIDFGICNIIHKPELLNSWWKYNLVKALRVGYRTVAHHQQTKVPFGANEALNYFGAIAQKNNYWENERLKRVMPVSEKSIKYLTI